MVPAPKKSAKSESLTIRLDPKTRFMLEFLSRARGQTITTVVERALAEAASSVHVDTANHTGGFNKVTWRELWSVSEAERAINIARTPELHPTYEEERRLKFAERWWQFFFINDYKKFVDVPLAEVLWPHIDEYIQMADSKRETDVLAAPDAMARALRAAGIVPPDWMPNYAVSPFDVDHPPDDDLPF